MLGSHLLGSDILSTAYVCLDPRIQPTFAKSVAICMSVSVVIFGVGWPGPLAAHCYCAVPNITSKTDE